MDIHNWFMDIHNWIMDIHNSIDGYRSIIRLMDVHKSIMDTSIIQIMDIHDLIYGYP